MSERDELMCNLRQLVELDRAAGIEFVLRGAEPVLAPTAPVVAPTPVATGAARAAAPAMDPPAPPAPRAAPPSLPLVAQSAPPADAGPDTLAGIAAQIAGCRACGLCATRTTTVPGEGAAQAELLFVGEGPGADEDASGRPFVGPAGQLLTKMIEAMGLTRGQVYIANIVKCRPPGNRTPAAEEVAACLGYLRRQVAVLRPKVICALGNTPLRALMGDETLGITRMRGRKLQFAGITLIPTFHPSYLLRNPEGKKPCWEDLQLVLKELGRELPKRGG
jgi:uracil-DNA glycosylase family 4